MMSALNYFKLCLISFTTLTLSLFSFSNPALAQNNVQDKFITIGTGIVTGVYYPTGGSICRLVNRGRPAHGIRCSVESTNGSEYNLNALRSDASDRLDVAVVQSDWQYHAYKGTDIFQEKGPFKELRSLFSLHSEAFTLVVRADSGINTLDDLVGKRVNVGNKGSGSRPTMDVLMAVKKWNKNTFSEISELKGTEQPQALCNNKIDAMIYSSGHPNGAVQEASTSCDVKIIPIVDKVIDDLIKENPFYEYTYIPGGMYAKNPNDIKTFGVKATLVTTTRLDNEVAYQLVKSVFDNFEDFRTLHPVFENLKPKNLALDGNTAPLHEGAKKYFVERGYIKADGTPN